MSAVLPRSSDWTKNTVNLSNEPLSQDVKCALGYGLSFPVSKEVDGIIVVRTFYKLEIFSDVPDEDININFVKS